jgi:hypothetical protein
MIVRVLSMRVRAGRVGAFNAIFRSQVPLLKAQPGLVYVKLARRLEPDGSQNVVLFEEWRDADSMYTWVGPQLLEPRLVPGAHELIEDLTVAHYEALDMNLEGDDLVGFAGAEPPLVPETADEGGRAPPATGKPGSG